MAQQPLAGPGRPTEAGKGNDVTFSVLRGNDPDYRTARVARDRDSPDILERINHKKDGKEHDKQEHGSYEKLSQQPGPVSHLCVLSLPLRLHPFLLPHLRETLTLVT